MSIAPDALRHNIRTSRTKGGLRPTQKPIDLKRRLAAGSAALALIAAAVVGVLWRSDGYTSAVANLSSGAVWLANTNAGLVTLINSNTNEAVWRVPVAEQGAALTTVQLDDGAAIYNPGTGMLTKVSTKTLDATATTTIEPGEATFATRGDQLYLFPTNPNQSVSRRDTATLTSLVELAIPGGTQGALDEDDRLWVLEAKRSTLHLVPTDQPAVSRAIDGAETAALAPTAGGVALIRPDGTITRAVPAGPANLKVRTEQLSIAATGWTAVQTGDELPDRLLLLDSTDARLGSCPTRGDCTLISLAPHAKHGDTLGTAQYADGVVFIPVHSTGHVILVDVATSTIRQQVPVLEQPAPFELTINHDTIWFNNPTTNEAGKINPDGTVTRILKYADELNDNTVRALVANGPGPVSTAEGISRGGTGSATGNGAEGPIDGQDPTAPETQDAHDPAPTTTRLNGPSANVPAPPEGTTPTSSSTSTSVTAGPTPKPTPAPSDSRTEGPPPPKPAPVAPAGSPGAESPPASQAPSQDAPPNNTAPAQNETIDGPAQPTPEPKPDTAELQAKMALSSNVAKPDQDITFEDRSTGEPDSRAWSFGDGTTATSGTLKHHWAEAGRYTVTLRSRAGR